VEEIQHIRIRNPAGLHARPCHAIVTTARAFQADFFVSCDGLEVNGKSILELMTLCAPCESSLTLRANGSDARELVAAVATLVEAGFGEM
jgi:phosphocarrier protein HPr